MARGDGPCGSERCWHAHNGRQCPPDPWPVVHADLVYEFAPNLPARYQRRCLQCGCNVSADHEPGSFDCGEARLERDANRRL